MSPGASTAMPMMTTGSSYKALCWSGIGDDSISQSVEVLVDVEVAAVEERQRERTLGVVGPFAKRANVDAVVVPSTDGVDVSADAHTRGAVVAVERLVVAARSG